MIGQANRWRPSLVRFYLAAANSAIMRRELLAGPMVQTIFE
jgi:hypothetical protein